MPVRTLLYDIETAPNIAYVWGKYDQNVLEYEQEWYILCFAYQWLDEGITRVITQFDFKKDFKADPSDDFRVVEKLHELFDAADVICAHNGNSFDQKKSAARFLYHGFDPPSPYRQIDTCREARKHFNFNSNKLGDLATTLGIGHKAETGGFKTWLSCMNGDKAAWLQMGEYNIQDVDLLREVYLRIRPWITNHPNVTMYEENDLDCCPRCGADAMTKQGLKRNKTTTVQQWKCSECGGWASSRCAEKVEPPMLVN